MCLWLLGFDDTPCPLSRKEKERLLRRYNRRKAHPQPSDRLTTKDPKAKTGQRAPIPSQVRESTKDSAVPERSHQGQRHAGEGLTTRHGEREERQRGESSRPSASRPKPKTTPGTSSNARSSRNENTKSSAPRKTPRSGVGDSRGATPKPSGRRNGEDGSDPGKRLHTKEKQEDKGKVKWKRKKSDKTDSEEEEEAERQSETEEDTRARPSRAPTPNLIDRSPCFPGLSRQPSPVPSSSSTSRLEGVTERDEDFERRGEKVRERSIKALEEARKLAKKASGDRLRENNLAGPVKDWVMRETANDEGREEAEGW